MLVGISEIILIRSKKDLEGIIRVILTLLSEESCANCVKDMRRSVI